jgi:GntR family transcriptional repressor for pyruvate dehydrogenase complex
MEKIIERMGSEPALYYHEKMIEAIKARDKELAVSMMRENLVKTEKAME